MPVLLALLAVAAVALVPAARLYLGQKDLIFRPGRRLDRSPADLGADYEAVRLPVGDTAQVEAWWIPVAGAQTTVLYFHGSDGNLTHELPVLRYLRALGLGVLAVEYPGYADAGKPSEKGCYAAARAAWNHVVDGRGIEPRSLVLFGMSLGGAVAVRLAAERQCGGLVVQGTFTSVPDLAAGRYPYLPVRLFVRTQMNSLEHIRRVDAPLVVVHSEDDEHIPVDHARRLVAAAAGPRHLVVVRGAHRDGGWMRSEEVTAAWRWLLAPHAADRESREGDEPCDPK